jgi:hypothetical protein
MMAKIRLCVAYVGVGIFSFATRRETTSPITLLSLSTILIVYWGTCWQNGNSHACVGHAAGVELRPRMTALPTWWDSR